VAGETEKKNKVKRIPTEHKKARPDPADKNRKEILHESSRPNVGVTYTV